MVFLRNLVFGTTFMASYVYCDDQSKSIHLEKAVEDSMWGVAEFGLGVVEVLRVYPLGGH
jgi:hypothetical protein